MFTIIHPLALAAIVIALSLGYAVTVTTYRGKL